MSDVVQLKHMSDVKIKVSIIIPVYNVDKYLDKCIQSVLSQTLKEIEIFLIDDGSSDKSWQIIKKYAKRDKRITAIRQENAGAAVARNRGLDLATGKYIGFVDSDDYIDPDYFEKLYNTAVKGRADIARAYVQSEITTSDGYQLSHSTEGYDHYYNVSLKKKVLGNKLNLTSSNWLAIYKRSMLDKNKIRFVPEIRTGQDNIFNLHVSYFANKVTFVEDHTYYHMNRRDGSLMTGYNFTTDGLMSRALVIKETVQFLNSIEDYDADVYVYRVKDVFNFFYSRLIKTNVDKASRQKLVELLVPIWEQVKYKKAVLRPARSESRFLSSLDSKRALNNYIVYIAPAKRVLSRMEKQRQLTTGKIRQNRLAYSLLRPPVHALRKVNKLVSKLLS